MAKSVLHTIEDNLSTFSKGQKRIGRYILDHYDQAAFMTASKLGKLTEVSESTVVRFAAELGFDGYPAMQKALQEMARNRLTSTQRIQAAENIYDRDVLSSVLQADIENLRQISMDEDRDTFQTAVEKIVHARHIYILGARSSTHLAGYLYFYMQMIFENVTLVQASAAGEIFEQLFRSGEGDVMIAFSFPRYSKDTINAAHFARSRGAEIIAITDQKQSPVAQLSSAALLAPSEMLSFIDSMTAPMSLINALLVGIATKMGTDVTKTFTTLERLWDTMYSAVRTMNKKIVVIGGGAAGMMAAVSAAEQGAQVTLLEPNERLGKKLNITGKGRCNVTNNTDIEGLLANIPRNGKFLYSAFNRFNSADVMAFFEKLGVPLKTERGNRVFPVSDSAFDISAALERRLKALKVQVLRDRASALKIEDGAVCGVVGERGRYSAQAVVLATGGVSYPATGSTGDGHRMAAEAGHTVTPLQGSLVPLQGIIAAGIPCVRLQGLSLRNVSLTVFENDKKIYTDFGELLFTHFGVSGPLVLSASAHMRHFTKKRYRLEIDLKPALDEQQLDKRLLADFAKYANHDFQNGLDDLLPQKLIPVVVELSGIPGRQKVHDLTREQRQSLLRVLKHFPVEVSGPCPVEDAIVTSGGVKVGEVDPKTMESKLVKNLYFAGELLDTDAYTGGFNLQIAWATGRLAGQSAANEKE